MENIWGIGTIICPQKVWYALDYVSDITLF